MPRRLWTSPMLPFFRGPDSTATSKSLQSLTEYLRGHVGFWLRFQGTTDVNGRLVVAHNCGFSPSAVLVTQEHVAGVSPHDMGAEHLHGFDEVNVDIHFFTKAGVDSASVVHAGYILLLPYPSER